MTADSQLGSGQVPLCVDLDGTLLRTDLLYESLLVLLSRNPLYVFLLPIWIFSGKARLKREIALRASPDPSTLPYDSRVLQLLADSPARPRVLCTASDRALADGVAGHLGLFELVLASDGTINLSGTRKADALVQRFGVRGFDYVGNAEIDLAVWRQARRGWVANAPEALTRSTASVCELAGYFPETGGGFKTWMKAARLHQWLKNLLVFLPLVAAHRFLEPASLLRASLAFLAFGLCASSVYLLNDLLDLHSDRLHPRKRRRPFALGELPLLHGLVVAPVLACIAFGLAYACNPWFALVLALYFIITFSYSLRLKRVVMLDVVVLAGLYTLRIIGGAVAIASGLSFWLLAFSMFLFFSLAILKRHVELSDLLASGGERVNGRGYGVDDLPLLQSLGAASGYISVMVLALYINSPESLALYRHPQVLWLLCPILLYWISRTWVVAHRGAMNDDPVIFAVTDRVSQWAIALCAVIVLGAV